MTMVSIETNKAGKAGKPDGATSRADGAPVPQVDTTDAQRFAGRPVVQWFKLQRAMEEILRYRASGKHYSARETSEVRSHARWKREACELCLAVRDGIQAGWLEPVKPAQDDE